MKKKIDYTKLTRHKASAMFPDQSASEFTELKASIKKEGLKTPILITPKGEVIDGWHRYTALLALKVKLTAAMFSVDDTSDPVALSWSLQLGRRNLSEEQRCALVVLSGGDDTARVRQHVSPKYWGDCLALKAAGEDSRLEAIAAGKAYVAAEMRAAGLREKKAKPTPAPISAPALLTPVRDYVDVPDPDEYVPRIIQSANPRALDNNEPRRHFIIPDTQVKPNVPLIHFKWLARYAAEKQPEVIVHLGDHFDLPSLSSYDKGTSRAEGKRLSKDLAAGIVAMRIFRDTLKQYAPDYNPEMHMLTGNHEERLMRHASANPELEGTLTYDMMQREEFGWKTSDFLDPITIDGVTYCHYFPRGPGGTVAQSRRGAPSARAQTQREGESTIAGHKQGLDVHIQHYRARTTTGIVAGSCYLHEEAYLTPQGTTYWRGAIMLNHVVAGEFSPWFIDLDWFCRRYEGKPLNDFVTSAKESELLLARV